MSEKISKSGIMYNTLASGSKFKGEFVSDSDFRIDGIFEGNITCSGKVVIGPGGCLIGNLNCTNAEIMGNAKGNIIVSEMLSLKAASKVTGDIKVNVLMIEPKAIFCGTCDMKQDLKEGAE